jgi:hypothetical protein
MSTAGKLGKEPRVGMGFFWGAVVGLVVFLYAAKLPLNCADFWYCLPSGQAVLERGRIEDPIRQCYTAGAGPYVTHRWLGHTMMYAAFRAGGPKLCVLVNAAVFALSYAALLALCLKRGGDARMAAGAALVAFFCGMENFGVRTQTVGVAAFVAMLALLHAASAGEDAGPRRAAMLGAAACALSAVWANTHASFPLAAVLVGSLLAEALYEGFALGEDAARRRAGVLGAMLTGVLAGFLLNPYGAAIFGRFRAVQETALQIDFTEWRATTIASATGKAVVVSVLLLLVVFKGSRYRLRVGEALWIVGFLVLGLKHQRHAIWWGLAAAPIIARHGADAMRTAWPGWGAARRPMWPVSWAVLGLLAVLSLFSTPYLKRVSPLVAGRARAVLAPETPVRAAAFLAGQTAPGERMWNPMHWGGYIAWQTKRKVFANDQLALLPPDVVRDYLTVNAAGAGWEGVLTRWRVTLLVVDRVEQPALECAAARRPDWIRAYEDGIAIIYRRK